MFQIKAGVRIGRIWILFVPFARFPCPRVGQVVQAWKIRTVNAFFRIFSLETFAMRKVAMEIFFSFVASKKTKSHAY